MSRLRAEQDALVAWRNEREPWPYRLPPFDHGRFKAWSALRESVRGTCAGGGPAIDDAVASRLVDGLHPYRWPW